MSLPPGTLLGPYEVTALIGEGGMGQVYRATDTNLGRQVAIKVLPDTVAHDPERLARFEREAKTLASLNHPNIAQIYGLEKADGIRALVMELVEGPTLADRIAQGPIPIDEALVIAKQIAEALEAAHERAIIHRDLKPANIKVRPDGTVKVLDFGLAKAIAPAGARDTDATASPTITSPALMTGAGVLLGTASYMSPEQAQGKSVDKRSDMFAFGCVVYEMLAGTRAFQAESVNDALAAVLRGEPNWDIVPETPMPVRVLLRRCLEKDRRERIVDATTAVFVLTERTRLGTMPRVPTTSWRRVAGLIVFLAALAALAVWMVARPGSPRLIRLTVSASGATGLTVGGVERDLAITPDGMRVVYRSVNQLLVRAVDQLEPTSLGASGTVRSLFVSPDSQWVGFFDDSNALKKVAISGGPVATLTRSDGFGPRGAAWAEDGSIVYATSALDTGLQRVSAAGGTPTVLTRPDTTRGEVDHFWPEFLPGGQSVLFTITAPSGALNEAQVAVLDLRRSSVKIVLRGGHHAHYVPTGHLLYGASGMLLAVPFDLGRLEVTGTPVPILDDVVTTGEGGIDVAVAGVGTLAYVPGRGALGARRSLVWVDRTGREEPLAAPVRAYQYVRISPDGTRIALDIRDQDRDIWIWAFPTHNLARLTFDPAQDSFPVWTRDSRRIVFFSMREGGPGVYWQAADGTGTASLVTKDSAIRVASSISPDGKVLVLNQMGSPTDVLLLPAISDAGSSSAGTPQPLLHTTSAEANGEISPNGRWLAYQSNETGRDEIYVRPFPDVDGGRWQVSTTGGRTPLWSPAGDELFFRSSDGGVGGVHVEPGVSWRASQPTQWVRAGYFQSAAAFPRQFELSPDGRRFLMIKEGDADPAATQPIVLVINWFEELKRLVPVN